MTVGVVHLPMLVEKIGLRWRLDVEEWPGVVSLLSTAKRVCLFVSIYRREKFHPNMDSQASK